jgi:hypothetical protein
MESVTFDLICLFIWQECGGVGPKRSGEWQTFKKTLYANLARWSLPSKFQEAALLNSKQSE